MKPIVNERFTFLEGYFNNQDNDYPQYPVVSPGLREVPRWVSSKLYRLQKKAVEDDFEGSSFCRLCGETNGFSTYEYNGWEWPSGLMHYIRDHSYLPSKYFLRFLKSGGNYRPRVVWGFTGSRNGCKPRIIKNVLDDMPIKQGGVFVVGGCVGVDTQIARLVKKYYPKVYLVVIVPADKKLVDKRSIKLADRVHYMPKGTDYRDRNEVIVKLSRYLIAFYNGYKISGTKMTMNIAERQGKLLKTVYHHSLPYKGGF